METTEVKFTDKMNETITENLRKTEENLVELLKEVDKGTIITPDGTKYVSMPRSIELLQCSKSHLYSNLLPKANVRKKYFRGNVYFNEGDLIELSNTAKVHQDTVFSKTPENDKNDKKSEKSTSNAITVLDTLIKEKTELTNRINDLNEKNSVLTGEKMFSYASNLFLTILCLIFLTTAYCTYTVQQTKILNVDSNNVLLGQQIVAKTAENFALKEKVDLMQTKGDQK